MQHNEHDDANNKVFRAILKCTCYTCICSCCVCKCVYQKTYRKYKCMPREESAAMM